MFHRWSVWTRLHPAVPRPAPLMRASDAVHHPSTWRQAPLLVRSFVPCWRLLRPLLTSRSGFRRRPFRHKTRSPQVRTHSFTAQPPDLRHFALTTRASRFLARSPCSAAPYIRFLFIGSQFRSTLPPHSRSPFRSCASLRSLWSANGGTCTRKSAPMLGAQKNPRRTAREKTERLPQETDSILSGQCDKLMTGHDIFYRLRCNQPVTVPA